jgi:hypothetical protein
LRRLTRPLRFSYTMRETGLLWNDVRSWVAWLALSSLRLSPPRRGSIRREDAEGQAVGVQSPSQAAVDAFRGLRDLSYVKGQYILLEWRWVEDTPDQCRVSDLVQLSVDLIVAGMTAASIAAENAMKATTVSGVPQLASCSSFRRGGG